MLIVPSSLVLILTSCQSDKGVVIYNTPPTADIISHDNGSEVFEGYPVEFRATVSDANHDIDQLTARWKVNGEEVCPFLPPNQAGENICVVAISEGNEEIMVEVRDPENASGGDTIYLNIVATEGPTAQIISPEESDVYYSDHIIAFEGKISDEEDDVEELLFNWKSNLDGDLSFDTEIETDGTVLGFGYLTEGQHAITLRVEDTTGKSTSANTTVYVGGPNNVPKCEITAPTTDSVSAMGELITFMGTVSDDDIPPSMLSVTWFSDKDSEIGTSSPNSSGNVTFPYSDLSVNTHVISMKVVDEKGSECVADVIHTVGTPPSVTINAPTIGIYNEDEPVIFSATVGDNEDQPNEILLEWTTSEGIVLNTQSATSDGNVEFTYLFHQSPLIPYGEQFVTLTGTDTDGLTTSDTVSFTINTIPTQPILTVLPENPKTGDDITASATGSIDADGGNVTYSYEWIYGSNTISGSTLSSFETAKGQEWTVIATPNDGTTDGPSVSQTVTIGNTAPTDLVVTITPGSQVYNNSEITCSATADDIDSSDNLEYSYEWSTGATTQTIILDGSLHPTNSVSCTVTVTDDTDSISDTTSVTLENRLPVVDSISITPDSVNVGEHTFNCEVETSDADGDDVGIVYEWTINGTPQQENSNMLSGSFTLGMVINCNATPNDGKEDGNVASDHVTIENAKPFVDSVTLDPEVAYTNDIITATATIFDEDTEQTADITATYSWHVIGIDGNDVEVQTGSDKTLSGVNHFDRDEEVYVIVTPNDGVEDGNPSISDSVTISNTPPTNPIIYITSEFPIEGRDNLICSIDVLSEDDDGDSIVYTYEWSDDTGVIQQTTTGVTTTSDTFLGSATSSGTWSCSVSAYDLQDYGNTVSDTVFVESVEPPSELTLLHAPNESSMTISWTGGQNSTTCTVEYEDALGDWQPVDPTRSFDCNNDLTEEVLSLPSDGWYGDDWSDVSVRITVDYGFVANFSETLNCNSMSGSEIATPEIDEDCNDAWDDQHTDVNFTCASDHVCVHIMGGWNYSDGQTTSAQTCREINDPIEYWTCAPAVSPGVGTHTQIQGQCADHSQPHPEPWLQADGPGPNTGCTRNADGTSCSWAHTWWNAPDRNWGHYFELELDPSQCSPVFYY